MLTAKQAERIKKLATEIIATLPKAHYLKTSTIKLSLDNKAPTSYFDPMRWRIVIAMTNIIEAIDGHKADEWEDLEPTIRALTYHEISHALLTPKDLFKEASSFGIDGDMTNIIEDERIETLLAHYYKGVDFKANAKAIIKYNAPRSFKEWVFYGLRIRKAPFGLAEMLAEFKTFILRTKNVNGYARAIALAMKDLLDALQALFDKYVKPLPQQPQQGQQPQNGQDQGKEQGQPQDGQDLDAQGNGQTDSQKAKDGEEADGEAKGEDGQDSDEDGEKGEQGKDAKGEKPEETDGSQNDADGKAEGKGEEDGAGENPLDAMPEEAEMDDISLNAKESENIMAKATESAKNAGRSWGNDVEAIDDIQADEDVKIGLIKAIIRNKGVGVAQAPVISGYNGKFSVKRYIKDQHLTMKWFDKTLDGGESEKRKGEKKILNIWLDQSGSFKGHDRKINRILSALNQIEKSRNDFEFRLIRIGCTFSIERNPSRRFSNSSGGNYLPKDEIEACYRETNKTQKEVNLVLFDGEVGKDDGLLDEMVHNGYSREFVEKFRYGNLGILNNKRTIFIAEHENTEGLRKTCPNCREIIIEDSDYEGRLTTNIIRAFDLLF